MELVLFPNYFNMDKNNCLSVREGGSYVRYMPTTKLKLE